MQFLVLIETYWNVNGHFGLVSDFLISINRNILECKSVFNVNPCVLVIVLIETYWNVNMAGKTDEEIIATSINRNILECK